MGPLAGIVTTILHQSVNRALDRAKAAAPVRDAVRDALDRVVQEDLDTAPIIEAARAEQNGNMKTRARPALVWSLTAQVGLVIAAGLLNAVAPETANAFIAGIERVMTLVDTHPTLSVVLGLASGGYIGARTLEKVRGVE